MHDPLYVAAKLRDDWSAGFDPTSCTVTLMPGSALYLPWAGDMGRDLSKIRLPLPSAWVRRSGIGNDPAGIASSYGVTTDFHR
jgi:hypothetical protein